MLATDARYHSDSGKCGHYIECKEMCILHVACQGSRSLCAGGVVHAQPEKAAATGILHGTEDL